MRIREVATALLAIGLLASCVDPTPTTPSPTGSPSAAPTSIPVEPMLGQPVIPLACADVVDSSEVAATLGGGAELVADEARFVRSLIDVVRQQQGALQCRWASSASYDGAISLDVRIVPSTEADADAIVGASGLDLVRISTPSGTSVAFTGCIADDSFFTYCTGQFFLDGYRIAIDVRTAESRPMTPDDIRTRVLGLTDLVGAHVRAAGSPRPLAVPSSRTAADVCAGLTSAGLPELFDASGPPTMTDPGDPLIWRVSDWPSGFGACAWSDTVYALVLADGSWAMPGLLNGAHDVTGFIRLTAFAGDTVLSHCPDGCSAILAVGDDLVAVQVDVPWSAEEFANVLVGLT